MTVCGMKETSKNLFVRCSPFVEISVKKCDSYSHFAEKGRQAVNLKRSKGNLKLFKVKEGIVIQHEDIGQGKSSCRWTIGAYCTMLAKRKATQMKIGVGYINDMRFGRCTVVYIII